MFSSIQISEIPTRLNAHYRFPEAFPKPLFHMKLQLLNTIRMEMEKPKNVYKVIGKDWGKKEEFSGK